MQDGASHTRVVSKSDHDFKVGHILAEGAVHNRAIAKQRDPLRTTGGAKRSTLLRWQGGAIPMDDMEILDRAAPVDITRVMRLVVGATFQQRRRQGRHGAGRGGRQQDQAGKQEENQANSCTLHTILQGGCA